MNELRILSNGSGLMLGWYGNRLGNTVDAKELHRSPLSTYVDLANAKRAAQPLPAPPRPPSHRRGKAGVAFLVARPAAALCIIILLQNFQARPHPIRRSTARCPSDSELSKNRRNISENPSS